MKTRTETVIRPHKTLKGERHKIVVQVTVSVPGEEDTVYEQVFANHLSKPDAEAFVAGEMSMEELRLAQR
jgi:hypothetical protein